MIFYKNSRVIFPDKVRDKVIAVDNGKIADICDNFDPNENDTVIDCHGLYLSPGFVDIHVHGGGKKSAMSENPQDIIEMAQAHLKYGTTSIVPTTLAAPISQLEKVTLSIKKASEACPDANMVFITKVHTFQCNIRVPRVPKTFLTPKMLHPKAFLICGIKYLLWVQPPNVRVYLN